MRLPRSAGGAPGPPMRWANPSTMHVLPTPASPTSSAFAFLR